MKIAMFTEAYKPVLNGVVNSILAVKGELEKRGHSVYVFTSGKTSDEDRTFSSIKIPLIQGYGISFPYYNESILQKMDIFHVHQPFILGWYAILKARKYNKPVVMTNHAQYHTYANSYFPTLGKYAQKFVFAYINYFINQCDRIILPIASYKDLIINKYKIQSSKIIVVPNCFFIPKKNMKRLKSTKKFSFLKNKKILVYCGRMSHEKNIHFLLRSFYILHKKRKDTHLILVGGGPLMRDLEHEIENLSLKDAVTLTGYIPHNKVFSYLKAADIFVSASKSEIHPLTLLEAMSAGAVAVALNKPGFKDTIQNMKDGILINGENEKNYADSILSILEQPVLLRKMRKSAQKRALDFLPAKIVPLIENVYAQAISEKNIEKTHV
jgi:glycosyltransferase involved in cell wall biosynthesis